MERLKNMELKKAFLVLSAFCLLLALLLLGLVFMACNAVGSTFPSERLEYVIGGEVIRQEEGPTAAQQRILMALGVVQLVSCIFFPVGGLALSGVLYYQIKLKEPIAALQSGIERIQNRDLDFCLPVRSEDELGRLCTAFDTMREELLKSNRELWRQAEERKRLNAAFSHDLRNPVTVLKGTVKLLQQGTADKQAIDRLETYTARIEQYVEAMSSIQRLEQMPVRVSECALSLLRSELEETAKLLSGGLAYSVSGNDYGAMGSDCSSMVTEYGLTASGDGSVWIDHGLFLTVAENLIGNAVRFAKSKVIIHMERQGDFLILSVTDDGPGYPEKLVQDGPEPFWKNKTAKTKDSFHFGIGLYSSQMLCVKHGGRLELENTKDFGAKAVAFFQIGRKP